MDNLLSGLESMGLGNMGNIDIFGDEKKKEEAAVVAKAKEPVKVDERSLILDKSCKCPVCDLEFKDKTVKTGKAKLLSQDIDLRPRYADIDSLKYGVIVCPICGYAALSKIFDTLGSTQAKLIKEKISSSFTGLGPEKELYSYDDAIARYKLALVNAVVKRGKVSERAYLCLQLAWLTRAKRETLPADTPDIKAVSDRLLAEEKDFLGKACDGLQDAFSKESFPLYVLDEQTSIYVIAALCAETGRSEEALRWVSRLIQSRNASDRIKEKARTLKDMVTNGEF